MGASYGKRETSIENLHTDHFVPIEGYEKVPLVSIELAVEPLISLLPSIQTYVSLVKQKCTSPADDLTPDQSAAIMLCTIRWQPYSQCLPVVLNTTLRSTDRQKLKPWFLYVKLLLTALCRLPSVSRTVYRGIKLDVSDQYVKDQAIIWSDFALCTTSLDLLQADKHLARKDRQTIFTIQCNSSKNITKHAFSSSTEMILLLPATQFKVVRCLKQKNHLHWIHLKEVESPFIFLQAVSMVSDLPRDSTHGGFSFFITPLSKTSQSWNYKPSIIDDRNRNRTLEQSIAKHPSYSPIYIKAEHLSNHDMKIIVQQAILDRNCTELWLCNTQITSQDALILSNGLYNNKILTKLNLNDNCIHDRGVHALARVLAVNNSTLKELYLARNGITSRGAQYLAEMLNTNGALTTLCLFGNEIDDDGIKYLTHVLSYYNTTLQYLFLSGNNLMTDRSIDYFIHMFEHNQSLKKLHLFNCNLTELGKTKLRKETQTKTYLALHM